jgi:hypothetical protein
MKSMLTKFAGGRSPARTTSSANPKERPSAPPGLPQRHRAQAASPTNAFWVLSTILPNASTRSQTVPRKNKSLVFLHLQVQLRKLHL